MTQKTLRVSYWTSTLLFSLWLVGDGLGGIFQAEAGKQSLATLGYPMYLLTIVGWAKLFAAVAILQTKWVTIKEWAFAGYTITCIGAFFSQYFSGASFGMIILPLFFLAFMGVTYFFWKQRELYLKKSL